MCCASFFLDDDVQLDIMNSVEAEDQIIRSMLIPLGEGHFSWSLLLSLYCDGFRRQLEMITPLEVAIYYSSRTCLIFLLCAIIWPDGGKRTTR